MKRGLKKAVVAVLTVALAVVLVMIILAACSSTATPTPASQAEAYVSSSLDTSYEGALPAATQLMLGTLLLEGTANAVTPEQARTLLPLWKALQGGALQGQAEVNAVLGQIERATTPEQLSAIAAMKLTRDDLMAWGQEHGIDLAQRPGGTPGVPGGGGSGEAPEARQTMRAGFDAMPEEERAQWMATAQAGGMPAGGRAGPGGRAGGGMGQSFILMSPLLELLTQRAGS